MSHLAKKISDAESEVMKVLWSGDIPLTERNILDAMSQESNWNPQTIKTFLKRLYDKGAVKREKREVFYYTPILTQDDYARERTEDFVNKVFGGNARGLISTMLSHDVLWKDDIHDLKQYWDERKKENE